MAVRERLLPWDSQPQEAVEIDRGLIPALQCVVLCSAGYLDLTNASFAAPQTGANISSGVNSQGRYLSFGTSSSLNFAGRYIGAVNSSTYAAVIVTDGLSGTQSILHDSDQRYVGNRLTITAGVLNLIRDGNVIYTGLTLTANTPYCIIASHNGTTGETYLYTKNLNTGLVSFVTQTSTGSNTVNGTLMIGNAREFSSPCSSQINLAAIAWGFLPAILARQWLDNPWQLFAPRSIWIPVSAAAAPSGFQAAWAHRQPRTIGAGVM